MQSGLARAVGRFRLAGRMLAGAGAILGALMSGALAFSSPVHADSGPVARVLSNFESYWGASMPRDCGFSRALPGRPGWSLWLFCDTPVNDWTGKLTSFITGSTAAQGPFTAGRVPGTLSELPTPPAPLPTMPNQNGPAQFLPTPAGLLTPRAQPCGGPGTGSYAASWLTGVAAEPGGSNSAHFLISYNDVCVTSVSSFAMEGMGLARYDPTRNVLVAQRRVFFDYLFPQQRALGSPVFHQGFLYLYAASCSATSSGVCTSGSIHVARVPDDASAWMDPLRYRWWDGAGWTAAHGSAASVLGDATPVAVTVDSYPGRPFVMIQQTDIAGGFAVYTASQPTGPWTRGRSARVPCSGGVGLDLCRALIGHPELSTAATLALSYYDPGESHVKVTLIPW